jgi:hypothetical protein
VFFFIGVVVFYLSVGVAARNVERSATYCTVGSDAETDHSHKQLELAGVRTFWKIRTLPDVRPGDP